MPNIFRLISEFMDFFNDQKKLDTLHYLMQGLSYRQVAEKIDKQQLYVQSVMNFLINKGLLNWSRWSIDIYKIGMKESLVFLKLKDINVPKEDNKKYSTYIHHVQAGETKVLVIYIYPKEEESEIKGEIGEMITPFYYTYTHFTLPFFEKMDLPREFFDLFDSVDNDKEILTGTPSFQTKKIYDDPITVYSCRLIQLLPEITPGILTEKLEEDFKDKEIEITYEKVKTTLNRMKEEEIIFPKNVLYLKPLSYQAVLVRIKTNEIYRIMGTFNKFNILTRVALTLDPTVFYLYIQYPFYQLSGVMEILDRLDPDRKTYIETKFIDNDTIYYQWSLERYLESKSKN